MYIVLSAPPAVDKNPWELLISPKAHKGKSQKAISDDEWAMVS